ncbi:DUF1902 domain-containing protein [uncultured Nostoc sp.]|uniref:DUF1902 domain-containing protein n=1 Tax=uncultured Nostoc sp. TaxID=340711 RepID=UPI00261D494F|nr:DUF1902 domain-containing protein [uncultured Nostoc sp.]
MMAQITFKVEAFWNSDAEVWVTTSNDVPGLVTEASTIEVLRQKLREIIPELIFSTKLFLLTMWVLSPLS